MRNANKVDDPVLRPVAIIYEPFLADPPGHRRRRAGARPVRGVARRPHRAVPQPRMARGPLRRRRPAAELPWRRKVHGYGVMHLISVDEAIAMADRLLDATAAQVE